MGFGVPFNPKPFCDSESPLCGVSAAPQFSLGRALCAGSASVPETLFVIQQLQEVPEWRQEQLILGTRYTQLVGWINEPLEWSLTSPWGNAGAGGSTGMGFPPAVPAAVLGVELVTLWSSLGAQGKLPSGGASRNRQSEKQSSWNLGIL